ncbi:hypothetical protein BGZ94_000465 [Podila epigama]|nr:hypothetical protein BGZ94_000465 [Podila epigama]
MDVDAPSTLDASDTLDASNTLNTPRMPHASAAPPIVFGMAVTSPTSSPSALSQVLSSQQYALCTNTATLTNELYPNGVQEQQSVAAVGSALDKDHPSSSPGLLSATKDLSNLTINIYHYRVFDIPEIVRCIAEFLDKPSLAAACRISRLWSVHCTPLLWRHIEDKNWIHSNFCSAIAEKAIYVRSMRCKQRTDYQEIALCNFQRLLSISFQGCKEGFPDKERIIRRASNTLTTLAISGVTKELTEANVRTICGIKNLEKLKISATILPHPRLAILLDQCANLEFLSLSRVQFLNGADQGVDNNELVLDPVGETFLSERETERCYENTVQHPTKIKYLALKDASLSCHYLSEITKLCPNLLELSLARNEDMYMTGALVQSMAQTCPNLYALDISSCKLLDQETFLVVFQSFPGMTVINLSGTHIGDHELVILAESCRSISRLDIQYCTSITSQGLHNYLSRCSSTLRHLEASGVIMDPIAFDDNRWTCINLETLFVHVSLFEVPKEAALEATTLEQASTSTSELSEDAVSGLAIGNVTEDTVMVDANDETKESLFNTEESKTMFSMLDKYNEETREAMLVHKNDRDDGDNEFLDGEKNNLLDKASNPMASTESSTDAASSSSSSSLEIVPRRSRLHPIQDLKNVQYLGIMGHGPKLSRTSQGAGQLGLLHGFQSVKRLNVLELYQTFQLDDLKWIIESLPELCRIDAEKYNVSDEVMRAFYQEPWSKGVSIHRNEF